MLVSEDRNHLSVVLERTRTDTSPKMSNTNTSKTFGDRASSSRSIGSSLVSAFNKRREKKKQRARLSSPITIGANEVGSYDHGVVTNATRRMSPSITSQCVDNEVSLTKDQMMNNDHSPKSALLDLQEMARSCQEADAVSVLTPFSTGNRSKTSDVHTLEAAQAKIHHLEHGSNNLKEALRQVLSSKRLVQIELQSFKTDTNALRLENDELGKRLAEEKKISKSLGLSDVEELRHKNMAMKNEIKNLSEKHRASVQQVLQTKASLNAVKDEMESMRVQHSMIESKQLLLEASKSSVENQYTAAMDDISKLHAELNKIKGEKLQHSQSIIDLQTELSKAQASLILVNTELNMARSKVIHAQSEKSGFDGSFGKKEIASVANEKKRFMVEINTAKAETRLAESELRRTEEENALKCDQAEQVRIENRRIASLLSQSKEKVTSLETEVDNCRVEKESLLKENHKLKMDTNKIKSSSIAIKCDMKRLSQDLQNLEKDYIGCKAELNKVRSALSDKEAEEFRLQEMSSEHDATNAQLQALRRELKNAVSELKESKKLLQEERDAHTLREEYLNKVQQFERGFVNSRQNVVHLLAENEIKTKLVEYLESQLSEKEKTRKKMLNTIQKLRGNIRVIVRIRPFLSHENIDNAPIEYLQNSNSLSIVNKVNDEHHRFDFDKVLPTSAGQEDVFSEVVDYVQSALDGFNICILFYGQTGAGKTFTMQGVGLDEMRGIIPRAIEYINEQKRIMSTKGKWSLSVNASFLEIYNEEIRDLFIDTKKQEEEKIDPTRDRCFSEDSNISALTYSTAGMSNLSPVRKPLFKTPPKSSTSSKRISSPSTKTATVTPASTKSIEARRNRPSLAKRATNLSPHRKLLSLSSTSPSKLSYVRPKLIIKRDHDGKLRVDGLTKLKIYGDDLVSELRDLLDYASKERSVGCTKLNAQSSRSHAIFILETIMTNDITGEIQTGQIHFCDLAGNEKFDDLLSCSQMKEVQAINKSLSCLGDVFHALSQGAAHVPFRNSKLTFLLQDCLSGHGKTLMIGNVSPDNDSSYESITTLRFVQQANKIELGRAMKNIQSKKKASSKAR